jgi:hypothetical protein
MIKTIFRTLLARAKAGVRNLLTRLVTKYLGKK